MDERPEEITPGMALVALVIVFTLCSFVWPWL